MLDLEHSEGPRLVSIILPVYNAQSTVEICIASLMRQDYPNTELIVVNDGSTDGTPVTLEKLSQRFPMRIMNADHRGRSEAKNLGMGQARGEILAFAEADARFDERWVSGALEYLGNNVGGVVGPRYCWSTDTSVAKAIDLKLKLRYHDPSFSPVTGWIFAKRALLEVGGFDPELAVAEDRDVGIRIKEKGYRIAFAPTSVIFHMEPRGVRELLVKESRHSRARTGFYRKYPRSYPIAKVALFWVIIGFSAYAVLANWSTALLPIASSVPVIILGQFIRLRRKARRAGVQYPIRYFFIASVLDLVRNVTSIVGATLAGISLIHPK